MTAYDVTVAGNGAVPADGWELTWIDRSNGVARLSDGTTSTLVVVEGSGSDWHVTIRGRRVPVGVRTWRERMLADAEVASRATGGPTDVKATLPGLVVVIEVEEGMDVEEGQPLLTLEAMKMQNEVRAPRAGRIASIAVSAGQAVATGELLISIA
jgi:acetyl/propionyl-CoA carboxylase alpha subunit